MRDKRIPQSEPIEERTKFWDTHDITDFESELMEATEPVFERNTMTISLQMREIEAIQRVAKPKRMSCPALIEEWVRQRLAAG